MFLNSLLERFGQTPATAALVWRDREVSYKELLELMDYWTGLLDRSRVAAGTVVALRADYAPEGVAALLALIQRGAIVLPITPAAAGKEGEFQRVGQVELIISVTPGEEPRIESLLTRADHPHYETLRERRHPGLVLFSSGSTGTSKGTVHDLVNLLEKYHTPRHNYRTLAFLLFDHIGGLDTLFYSLFNGSTLVIVEDRSPHAVCAAVERHHVEVLPVAPSFINLLALSGAFRDYDLSSLKYVTYGAEVMPESTLKRCHEMFPGVTLLQKYGASEVGTLRSKSRAPDSLWVKMGGDGFEWRVVDGLLEIKARSAMLGYLNAPSPFTPDGWFKTGDCVEVDGDYLRILGRQSDIINVGGQKVFPAEVEDVLRRLENVMDAAVYGEPHPLLGAIVCARVRLTHAEPLSEFRVRMRRFCADRLETYKIPSRVVLTDEALSNARFKQNRRPDPHSGDGSHHSGTEDEPLRSHPRDAA